jgi:hypothetical protein
MLTADAISHFRTKSSVATVLGISPAAVSKWGAVVPIESALALEIMTARTLRVDRALYPSLARALDIADQAKPAA